ncbi:hypothetical protein [Amycolatopsis granulosa]|uniref:hypothetical protein n=1 Tax=Amycolatopsis granulosa TaxID=185684 RepID=UPI0014220B18|nr:hypothetical protein [Amycolatopsis granulosa]NIH87820.1 hypothetical protein [Amycolatopsis granulosa]
MTVTFLLLARLPEDGAAAFDAYEDSVLPLLSEYGGRLERRVRSLDDRTEAHLVSFPGEQEFAAYRADPRRAASAPLLERSGAVVELLPVREITSRNGS